jgi:methyltransferase (TIGR00027 family)
VAEISPTNQHPVSMTALWMAADRARESARPDRLFYDPLAGRLAGADGVELMARMEAGLPANPTLSIRTRFFDDTLTSILTDHPIGQVVMLAAGMDARAFRMRLPTVFEIDHPDLLEVKNAHLSDALAQPLGRRVTVGADLTGQWAAPLVESGFDAQMPAVFLAEGLLGYLEAAEVDRLFDALDLLAESGSFLLTDVSGQSALNDPSFTFWLQRMATNGIIGGRFGTHDPAALLASHGWDAVVSEYGGPDANFGRWPWPPVDRNDPSAARSYLIVGSR